MAKDWKHANVAVAAIWYERFLECSRSQGMPYFTGSVWRFYHSLLNIGEDKLAIKDIVRKYLDETWYPKFLEQCDEEVVKLHANKNPNIKKKIHQLVTDENILSLFEVIIQTIQDSGRGWPTIEEMQSYTINQE